MVSTASCVLSAISAVTDHFPVLAGSLIRGWRMGPHNCLILSVA